MGVYRSVGAVPIPPAALIVVVLVIFGAYLVFGVTGFGASPITIPVLVHLLPLTSVLPLAALLCRAPHAFTAAAAGAGAMILIKHISNLKRLLDHRELGIHGRA